MLHDLPTSVLCQQPDLDLRGLSLRLLQLRCQRKLFILQSHLRLSSADHHHSEVPPSDWLLLKFSDYLSALSSELLHVLKRYLLSGLQNWLLHELHQPMRQGVSAPILPFCSDPHLSALSLRLSNLRLLRQLSFLLDC